MSIGGDRASPWTPELVAKFRILWGAGIQVSDIARRLGISKNSVVSKRRRLHLPERGSPIGGYGFWTKERDAELRRLAEKENLSAQLIAEKIGSTHWAVYKRAKKLGVAMLREEIVKKPPAPPGLPRIKIKSNKRYKPGKISANPIMIPLRKVYELSAAIDLPLSLRGNLQALNAATRRTAPEHPGYVVSDSLPSPIRWRV